MLFNFKKLHREELNEDKMLTRALLPSILSIVFLLVILTGTSFAWFSESQNSGNLSITSGNYSLELSIQDDLSSTIVSVNNLSATLNENSTYNVTIKRNGTINNGYGVLTLYGEMYLIENIPDEGVSFQIKTYEKIDNVDFVVGVMAFLGSNKPDISVVPSCVSAGNQGVV